MELSVEKPKGSDPRVEKFKVDVINVALVKEGMGISSRAEGAERAARRLSRAYVEWAKKTGQGLVVCDNCGGESPADPARCPCCPFCGSADPIEGADAQSAAVAVATPEALATAASAEVVEREVSADERKLDAAVDRVRVFCAEARGASWDAGNALREIEEKSLWRARTDAGGKARHKTFDDFVQAEFGFTARWARDVIDLAKEFTREQVMTLGRKKLIPIARLTGEARAGLLDRAPEMSAREVSREVAVVADGAQRETGRERQTPVPTNGKPSRAAALRARREEILAARPDLTAPEVAKELGISVPKLAKVMRPVARASLRDATAAKHALIFPRAVDQADKGPRVAKAEGKPAPRKLTLIALEGRVPVPLYARRKKPGDDRRRAQEVSDDPQGRLVLLNGTELRLSVRRGKKGLVVDVTVQESSEG